MLVSSHCTGVLGEADGQGAVGNLILKQVFLVQKQDDGGLSKPLVVADGVKQLHALVHPVLSGHKWTHKEIIGERNSGVLKEMSPLHAGTTPLF